MLSGIQSSDSKFLHHFVNNMYFHQTAGMTDRCTAKKFLTTTTMVNSAGLLPP